MKEVKRPWGDFKQFVLNKNCTVKLLTIKPKQELSLQYHLRRKESWYFLTPGKVQIGNNVKRIKKGELVEIPKKKPHRIIAEKKEVMVLEISHGTFSERDEVRIEDRYGRK